MLRLTSTIFNPNLFPPPRLSRKKREWGIVNSRAPFSPSSSSFEQKGRRGGGGSIFEESGFFLCVGKSSAGKNGFWMETNGKKILGQKLHHNQRDFFWTSQFSPKIYSTTKAVKNLYIFSFSRFFFFRETRVSGGVWGRGFLICPIKFGSRTQDVE